MPEAQEAIAQEYGRRWKGISCPGSLVSQITGISHALEVVHGSLGPIAKASCHDKIFKKFWNMYYWIILTSPDFRGVVLVNLYINVIEFCRSHILRNNFRLQQHISSQMVTRMRFVQQFLFWDILPPGHCVLDKIMNMDALSAKMSVVLYLVSQTMQDITWKITFLEGINPEK
jgi:hypothetical protein